MHSDRNYRNCCRECSSPRIPPSQSISIRTDGGGGVVLMTWHGCFVKPHLGQLQCIYIYTRTLSIFRNKQEVFTSEQEDTIRIGLAPHLFYDLNVENRSFFPFLSHPGFMVSGFLTQQQSLCWNSGTLGSLNEMRWAAECHTILHDVVCRTAEFNKSGFASHHLASLGCFFHLFMGGNEVFGNRFPCLQINWTAAVETLLKATGLSEEDRLSLLASELPVSLQCRDFLPELGALLSSTPSRYWKGVSSFSAILYL